MKMRGPMGVGRNRKLAASALGSADEMARQIKALGANAVVTQLATANDVALVQALGAALFRAGQFKAALERLNQAAQGQDQSPSAWLFLAMVHHHLGNTRDAGGHLQKAVRWMEAEKDRPVAGGGGSFDDWPTLEVLRREAEALLKTGNP